MGNFTITIPELGKKFIDYRTPILGDSFNWSWVRPLTQVQYLAIHHSAGPSTQTVDQIAAFHVNSRGWGGIGYHFVINQSGVVYYVGDITTARAHVYNYNHLALGICLIGNFTSGQEPAGEQILSAHKLCSKLFFRTPELPNVNGWEDLRGHKDFSATACPGDNWPGIRQKIISIPGMDVSKKAEDVTKLYRTILGREPDQGGLDHYVASAMSIEEIRKEITESVEHAGILNRANKFKEVQRLTAEVALSVTQALSKVEEIKRLT